MKGCKPPRGASDMVLHAAPVAQSGVSMMTSPPLTVRAPPRRLTWCVFSANRNIFTLRKSKFGVRVLVEEIRPKRNILFIGLLFQGVTLDNALSAIYTRRLCTREPALQPLSLHSCPNESVTFTCSDTQVSIMKWEVEPRPMGVELSYIPSQMMADPGRLTMNSTDNVLLSTLVHLMRILQTWHQL